MANQTSASMMRRIFFRSRGGSYTAMLAVSTGDLFQQYRKKNDVISEYFPDFAKGDVKPVISMIITSSQGTGKVTPDSIVYSIEGTSGATELAFDDAGNCTTTGLAGVFKKVSNGLQVIGNIANLFSGAGFVISAKAKIGTDYVIASIPVSISEYTDTAVAKVSIVPGDANNFTITSSDSSTAEGKVVLKASVFRNGKYDTTTQYKYLWEKLVSGEYKQVDGSGNVLSNQTTATPGTNSSITVPQENIDTYADFRLTVYEGTKLVGTDTQGVMDASDPYDIVPNVKRSIDGKDSSLTVTNDETLDDTMPNDAYLMYEPQVIARDTGNTYPGTVTWKPGAIITASGLNPVNVPVTGGKYKIKVSDLSALGVGEFEFVFSAELS